MMYNSIIKEVDKNLKDTLFNLMHSNLFTIAFLYYYEFYITFFSQIKKYCLMC